MRDGAHAIAAVHEEVCLLGETAVAGVPGDDADALSGLDRFPGRAVNLDFLRGGRIVFRDGEEGDQCEDEDDEYRDDDADGLSRLAGDGCCHDGPPFVCRTHLLILYCARWGCIILSFRPEALGVALCHFDRRRVAWPILSFRPEARSAVAEKSMTRFLDFAHFVRSARNDERKMRQNGTGKICLIPKVRVGENRP